MSAVEAWRLDLFARGKSRQRFEAEVDADLARAMRAVFRDLDLQIEVQTQELAAAGGELDQVEARGPVLVVPSGRV